MKSILVIGFTMFFSSALMAQDKTSAISTRIDNSEKTTLRLSSDIGKMSGQIGKMGDKIIKTQQIQSNNFNNVLKKSR